MQKFSRYRLLPLVLAVGSLGAALSACAPVVLGGVALSGLVAADRRTTGTQVEDETIELYSVNLLHGQYGDSIHVNVTSYNRQVLLTGEVPTEAERQTLVQAIAGIDNARSVVNELAVMPTTPLTQRSNDTFITGKVRASLVDAKDLPASAFKVVTERGIVYLMGRVTPREAARAGSIASGVTGVVKVVRVFEYVTEEDLARQNAPRPAPVSHDNSAP